MQDSPPPDIDVHSSSRADNETTCAAAFLKHASLNQSQFFQALHEVGFPDISSGPLAGSVFRGLEQELDNGVGGGITLSNFHEVLDTATKTRTLFQMFSATTEDNRQDSGGGGDGDGDEQHVGISLERFQEMGVQFLLSADQNIFPSVRAAIQKGYSHPHPEDADGSLSTTTSTRNSICASSTRVQTFVRSMLDSEAFARYNASQTGKMNEAELLSFVMAIRILCHIFNDLVPESQRGLTRESYPLALKRIGVACLERTFQGQFMDAVYLRSDRDESGVITFADFVKAGMTLIYPVAHTQYIRTIPGYPGWSELAESSPATSDIVDRIVQLVSSLKTGDVLLMQDNKGPMGQFINFSLNTPWTHASVVVKRSPLTGTPNSKTEELLREFPFRRSAHKFCTPGYCRCFDSSEGDFAPSRFTGLGQVGLLESTGEGIHLYDFAHRLLESGQREWASIAVARLNDAPDREDTTKINVFIESVRGGIYTVAKDELKAAIAFHRSDSAGAAAAAQDATTTTAAIPNTAPLSAPQLPRSARGTDDFCASLVQRFYHHMGWVDSSRPFNSVMPSDFDVSSNRPSGGATAATPGRTTTTHTSHPVKLLEGKGWLSPLELVTCPDLNARLPMKLPTRQRKLNNA